MNSNTTIQELPIANLTALLNDKLVKCLVLSAQRMDESEISIHALKRIDDFEILYDPNNYGKVVSIFGNIKVLTMLCALPS